MAAEMDWIATVRATLSGAGEHKEVRMFGGIGFMINGNLAAAVSKRGLLLRVGAERQVQALAWPGTRQMVMRGRAMEGYVYIDPPAIDAAAIKAGLGLAVPYVRTLPEKPAKGKGAKK